MDYTFGQNIWPTVVVVVRSKVDYDDAFPNEQLIKSNAL